MKKIKLIGAPTNLGYMNREVALSPQIFRDKGLMDVFKIIGVEAEDLGNVTRPEILEEGDTKVKYLDAVEKFNSDLRDKVAESIKDEEDFPLIIGGDHSMAIGSVFGVAQKRNIGVLWIDAHCDAHTPDTTYTGWIYGMPVAVLNQLGHERLLKIGGESKPIKAENFCIFGPSYYEAEEVENIRKLGIKLFTMDDIIERGLSTCLREAMEFVSNGVDSVHVSFDLDALDEYDAPGTTEPSKGQFTYREISYITKKLGAMGKVGSLDVCEYDVSKDRDNKTVNLAFELIAKILGKSYSEYDLYLAKNKLD